MSFLAPLFLAGALGLALPVIFHLVRRSTREKRVFGSLMFLHATPPRLTRRNRLEDLLLLLLRCAAICLLAFGFARPFVKHALPESSLDQPPKECVILLDTSASMRRADLWSQARDKADAVLRRTSPADRVAIFTFDLQPKPLITFEEWKATPAGDRVALARSRLANTKPGWAATRLDQAILRATEILAELEQRDAGGPRQIVVISDFQEGSKFGALQGQDWPKGVEVISERVTARTSNAGLQLLATANDLSTNRTGLRLRVSNEANSKRENFELGWARPNGDFVGKPTEVYVPAGQNRVVTLPTPDEPSGADHLRLRGDDEDFDNSVYYTPPAAVRRVVAYLGSDSADNPGTPLYFARRALTSTAQQIIELGARPVSSAFPASDADAELFIVSDALTPVAAGILRNQVSSGKTLLFVPTTAEAASTMGFLFDLGQLNVTEAEPRNYAMLGEIDFRHPLFAPFADARYSDFTKIHFWKYRKFNAGALPNARIVASFDNGDPAMLDLALGRGRVIALASGWHPADSQLALSSKFVPLLCSILDLRGGIPAIPQQIFVGDAISAAIAGLDLAAGNSLVFPDGTTLKLLKDQTNFTQATMPGIYHVNPGNTEKQFAVNLDAAESRTAPLPLDELEQLGVPVPKAQVTASHAAQSKAQLRNVDLENRQKLWRWFIVATLAVLLFETGLAGWSTRKNYLKAEAIT